MNISIIEDSIRNILFEIEGVTLGHKLREGLRETPSRVGRAYQELFDGYNVDITSIFKAFDGEGTDQIVALKDIEFTSICEHHVLPFFGIAHIAYLPNDRIIGASKLVRVVNAFAHRLQIQERLTEQIGKAIMDNLNPFGTAVIIEARHSCMVCRGVRSSNAKLVTSVMLGQFRDDAVTKQEVLALLGLVK